MRLVHVIVALKNNESFMPKACIWWPKDTQALSLRVVEVAVQAHVRETSDTLVLKISRL